jgi:hypothetical protein
MLKFVTALSAALIIGWALVGSATTASAGGHRGHRCCGPIPPAYTYKTKKVVKNVTRYRDVYRNKYVKRIKPIVHVTRIQPVVHVHKVTRVHTRIVGVVHPVHHRVTRVLPPRTYTTSSVVHLRPICGCGPHRPY